MTEAIKACVRCDSCDCVYKDWIGVNAHLAMGLDKVEEPCVGLKDSYRHMTGPISELYKDWQDICEECWAIVSELNE